MIITNGKTILGGSIRSSSGLADEVQRLPPRVRYLCCAMYGAGEGNRTLDIQLGKLGVCQAPQQLSCKTARIPPQWLQRVSVRKAKLTTCSPMARSSLARHTHHVAAGRERDRGQPPPS